MSREPWRNRTRIFLGVIAGVVLSVLCGREMSAIGAAADSDVALLNSSTGELGAARELADQFYWLSVSVAGIVGMLSVLLWDRCAWDYRSRDLVAYLVLAMASILDAGTTVDFMQRDGVGTELHPGIKLMAFRYGPIYGVVLGKLAQFAGVFYVSRMLRGRWRSALLVITTILFAGGAGWNRFVAQL